MNPTIRSTCVTVDKIDLTSLAACFGDQFTCPDGRTCAERCDGRVECPGGEDMAIPEMTGRLPLEILVEIGIEKLKRDYVHSIMSSYLAGKDNLAPFLAPAQSRRESLANLHRLHVVVELIAVLQTYLLSGQGRVRWKTLTRQPSNPEPSSDYRRH